MISPVGEGSGNVTRSTIRGPEPGGHGLGSRTGLGVLLLLTIAAVVPRVVNLGGLGFYADEDLTALSARALLEDGQSVLPSGLEYRRALPYTWLAAGSAALLGQEGEAPYRLPAALLGSLTVLVLFFFGRTVVGTPAAFVAALMLALSEWHLVFSRQARMYTGLVCCIVLAAWGFWSWARTGRGRALLGAGLAYAVGVDFHLLGVIGGLLPLVWLALPGATRVGPVMLVGVAVVALASGFALSQLWSLAPYQSLDSPPGASTAGSVLDTLTHAPLAGLAASVLALAGAGVGIWLVVRLRRVTSDTVATEPWASLHAAGLFTLGGLAGVAAALGQVYGFGLAFGLLIISHGKGFHAAWRPIRTPLLTLLLPVAGWFLIWGVREGPWGAVAASASYPYPHVYHLLEQFPGVMLAFACVCAWFFWTPVGTERPGVGACILTAVALIGAHGFVGRGEATRYLFPLYPFVLLTVAAGLAQVSQWLIRRFRLPGVAQLGVIALVLSGGLTGHGIPQAIRLLGLRHGEAVNPRVHMFPFRPDHRSAGAYVRERRVASDIVIAEDPSVQHWYAGEIDYWFRRFGDMRQFLTRTGDGVYRDIYVGSRPLPDPSVIDSMLRRAPGRVWLITSGETQSFSEWYLSSDQRVWLDSLMEARSPDFVAEDGVTAVFCLTCGAIEAGVSARPGVPPSPQPGQEPGRIP